MASSPSSNNQLQGEKQGGSSTEEGDCIIAATTTTTTVKGDGDPISALFNQDSSSQPPAAATTTTYGVSFAATSFHTVYILTRYRNLRCFPACSAVHKEKHFCGCPVTIFVTFPSTPSDFSQHDLYIFGQFRQSDAPSKFVVGSTCDLKRSPNSLNVIGAATNDNHFTAALVQITDSGGMYTIYPPRKWKCDADVYSAPLTHAEQHGGGSGGVAAAATPVTTSKSTPRLFVFAIYVVDTRSQICVATVCSSTFKLVGTSGTSASSSPTVAVSRPDHSEENEDDEDAPQLPVRSSMALQSSKRSRMDRAGSVGTVSNSGGNDVDVVPAKRSPNTNKGNNSSSSHGSVGMRVQGHDSGERTLNTTLSPHAPPHYDHHTYVPSFSVGQVHDNRTSFGMSHLAPMQSSPALFTPLPYMNQHPHQQFGWSSYQQQNGLVLGNNSYMYPPPPSSRFLPFMSGSMGSSNFSPSGMGQGFMPPFGMVFPGGAMMSASTSSSLESGLQQSGTSTQPQLHHVMTTQRQWHHHSGGGPDHVANTEQEEKTGEMPEKN